MITSIQIGEHKVQTVEVPDYENGYDIPWDLVDSGQGYFNRLTVRYTAPETGWYEFICRSFDAGSYLNASVQRNGMGTKMHETRGNSGTILLVWEKVLKGDTLALDCNRLQTGTYGGKSARFYPMKVF
jgi:hypothetical protein